MKRWHVFLPELLGCARAVVWTVLLVVMVIVFHALGWLPG